MNILTNKQYKTYSRLSRYQSFPIYFNTEDNKWVKGTDSWLADDTSYALHVVQEHENLDILAFKYYNNPTYYWILASFNHITDPFAKLIPGTVLKVPSMSLLEYEE